MSADLEKMSYAELLALQTKTQELIAQQREQALIDVVAQVRELAEKNDIEISDIISKLGGNGSGEKTTKNRKKVEPKYQHPTDPNVKYSGQGRKPRWVLDYIGTDKYDASNPEHVAKIGELLID